MVRWDSIRQDLHSRMRQTDAEVGWRWTCGGIECQAIGSYKTDAASRAKLYGWRRSEVISSAESINGIHSPLSCGDIFRRLGPPKHYVLLRQGCDLMVRNKTGFRVAKEAIFGSIEIDDKRLEKDETVNDIRFFELATVITQPDELDGRGV